MIRAMKADFLTCWGIHILDKCPVLQKSEVNSNVRAVKTDRANPRPKVSEYYYLAIV